MSPETPASPQAGNTRPATPEPARQAWTPPRRRHLATSAADDDPGLGPDAEGNAS
jgi:hypothetical protein